MPLVTITINNKNFQLSCAFESQKEITALSEQLNNLIADLKDNNRHANSELLLVMASLELQNRINQLQEKLDSVDDITAGKEISDRNLTNDQKLSETLSAIANYLENIAQKLSK